MCCLVLFIFGLSRPPARPLDLGCLPLLEGQICISFLYVKFQIMFLFQQLPPDVLLTIRCLLSLVDLLSLETARVCLGAARVIVGGDLFVPVLPIASEAVVTATLLDQNSTDPTEATTLAWTQPDELHCIIVFFPLTLRLIYFWQPLARDTWCSP